MIEIKLDNDKIFETQLDINLQNLVYKMEEINEEIKAGKFLNITSDMLIDIPDYVNSYSSYFGKSYNLFDLDFPDFITLKKSISLMLDEAIIFYNIKNMSSKDYKVSAWFNCHGRSGKSPLHDHPNKDGYILFHGYYCVNAEPSITHYKINDQIIDLHNKNNRAILFKNGYSHGIGEWNSDQNRITIAYDIIPKEVEMSSRIWTPLIND